MRDIIKGGIGWLWRAVPASVLFPLVRNAIQSKARGMAAEARMRDLLLTGNFLANELADAGQALGGGSHVKHRLMGYHAFFAERIGANDHVLDVGCGGGELAVSIARDSGATVTAIDNDRPSIARAHENCAGLKIEVVEGDVLSWRPPSGITVLVLSNVLEHIDARAQFLRQLFENTSAERALIRVPLYERDWTVPMREQLGIEWRLDVTHFTEYRIPQFHEEIADAGAEVREIQIRWSEIWAVVVPKAGPSA